MAFDLPPAIYSPQLLELVIFELEQYNTWYQESVIKQKVGVKTATPEPNNSQETMLVIKSWQTKNGDKTSLPELIKALKSLNLPIIHLTLAGLPNHQQRAELVAWFQKLSDPCPLLLFSSDRSLGGGIVVRTPNHIYDWSFQHKLEAARANIGQVIANA